MNRALFAFALGVVGLGLMGCAAGVEDPIPPTPAPEAQRDPPQQILSGDLGPTPGSAIVDHSGVVHVDPLQRPPIPGPIPMAEGR